MGKYSLNGVVIRTGTDVENGRDLVLRIQFHHLSGLVDRKLIHEEAKTLATHHSTEIFDEVYEAFYARDSLFDVQMHESPTRGYSHNSRPVSSIDVTLIYAEVHIPRAPCLGEERTLGEGDLVAE